MPRGASPAWAPSCLHVSTLITSEVDAFTRLLRERVDAPAVERANIAKAEALYAAIDGTGFYRNPVRRADRSRMSVPFFLRDARLDVPFLEGAKARGLVQLKGHRAVGGMRASIYNAMPLAGVLALVDWMHEFERCHG
jgi:phosphoserine aminotransferase